MCATITIFDNEVPITIQEARGLIPHRPDVSTIFRWAIDGVRGVKLEHARIGRRVVTSREAVQRFIAALTKLDQEDQGTTAAAPRRQHQRPTTSPRRQREIEAAEARLAAAGFAT